MRAVILTKSYKDGGWCVVAYDLENYKLVRLVTTGGGSIPKDALFEIDELDEIRVKALEKCPDGPQTENVLVDEKSFNKVCHCAFGIDTFINILPMLPSNEPRFMSDCNYRYSSVCQFHHSIEIIRVHDVYIYWEQTQYDEEPKRRCRFSTQAGLHSKLRITTTDYNEQGKEVHINDAYAVITIPMKPWKPTENESIYFKFVAALYVIGNPSA